MATKCRKKLTRRPPLIGVPMRPRGPLWCSIWPWGSWRKSARELIAGGRAATTTPVAVVQWGTTPRQRAVHGTLADISERVRAADLGPPSVVIVGEVARFWRHPELV